MAETTVTELLREVRKPGKVRMPVSSRHDLFPMFVEKADLIYLLEELAKPEYPSMAPWYVVARADGVLFLDVQDEEIL